ncbi:MAG: type I-MYXAN CRISPR-associated Cas8a1/Cmx1, partial [Xenococcus sp. (in: cyanobacteria)]
AGVAGLYMTLKALEKRYPTFKTRQGNLKWVLTANSICLNWKGDDYAVLDWLFKESFQISDLGLISLTGLNPQTMNLEAQLAIHIGIKNTFIQHNEYYISAGDGSESLIIEGKEFVVDYKKVTSYAYQEFAEKLCDKNGQLLQQPIGITGLLYPGAARKHYAFKQQTQFTETLERALALLFAPVACFYLIAPKSYLHDTKTQYFLVIPDITDLQLYLLQRKEFNNWDYQNFYASGYSDASLRFLLNQRTINLLRENKIKRCKVITFGQTQWTAFQKIRKSVDVINITDNIIRNYQLCDRYFNNRIIKGKDGNFIVSSIVRELITENLAKDFPWWHNFALAVRDKDLFKLISYEKEGLQQMVRNTDWDEESQKIFVKACHRALYQIRGKLSGRAKENEYVQFDRENERIRSGLIRCQNSEDFRHFMTANFWSKGGIISILADHWEELMPLTTKPENWKLARDLALLALASYKNPKESDDKNNSASSDTRQSTEE